MKRSLLLNADWTPLSFVSDVRAIILLYKGRAEVVSVSGGPSVWDETFKTSSITYQLPATLRLLTRVNRKWKSPRFRKKVLFNRDNWACQYCLHPLTWDTITIDHVHPRSKGGKTSWKNCVAACKSCNKRKADMSVSEAGMSLVKQPAEPNPYHFWGSINTDVWHADWSMLLPRA